MILIYALAAALIALQVADVLTTRRILALGGYEKNPAMAWVILHTGIVGLAVLKVAFIALVIYAASRAEENLVMTGAVFFGLVAFYARLVRSNLRVIRELRP
jgi:hypothetical protein